MDTAFVFMEQVEYSESHRSVNVRHGMALDSCVSKLSLQFLQAGFIYNDVNYKGSERWVCCTVPQWIFLHCLGI